MRSYSETVYVRFGGGVWNYWKRCGKKEGLTHVKVYAETASVTREEEDAMASSDGPWRQGHQDSTRRVRRAATDVHGHVASSSSERVPKVWSKALVLSKGYREPCSQG
jgi:hypothetical protein